MNSYFRTNRLSMWRAVCTVLICIIACAITLRQTLPFPVLAIGILSAVLLIEGVFANQSRRIGLRDKFHLAVYEELLRLSHDGNTNQAKRDAVEGLRGFTEAVSSVGEDGLTESEAFVSLLVINAELSAKSPGSSVAG